jgi:hypothetical protein
MLKLRPTSLFSTKHEFLNYVRIYNSNYSVHSNSKDNYLELMKMYAKAEDYHTLLGNSNYVSLAYRTLQDWNMDERGAKLVDLSAFRNSILSHLESLAHLKGHRLELLSTAELAMVLTELKSLFVGLKVMQTRARIVGVSKTLHFLVPNLVMPVDRGNILSLLYLGSKYSANPEREFQCFTEIFEEYRELCHKLDLSVRDVNGLGWNSSIPKMIDNALIGFLSELLKGNIVIKPI